MTEEARPLPDMRVGSSVDGLTALLPLATVTLTIGNFHSLYMSLRSLIGDATISGVAPKSLSLVISESASAVKSSSSSFSMNGSSGMP